MRPDKEFLDTDEAAALLGRRPQTLRRWHCKDEGPIKPVVLNGRLRWSRAAIDRLHGIERDQEEEVKSAARLPTGRGKRRGASTTSDRIPTAAELLDVLAIARKLARSLDEHLQAGRVGSAKRTVGLLDKTLAYGRKDVN